MNLKKKFKFEKLFSQIHRTAEEEKASRGLSSSHPKCVRMLLSRHSQALLSASWPLMKMLLALNH